MKILVVTTKSPYPLYEGRALRTYNLIRQTAREHEVHLLSFVQTPEEVDGIEHMKQVCASVKSVPLYMGGRGPLLWDALRELVSASPLLAVKYRSAAMFRHIDEALAEGGFDLVHLDMLHLADYIERVHRLPVVLVEHNVESVLLERRVQAESHWFKRAYFGYQLRKLRRYEAWACAAADHVVAVSDNDGEQLKAMAGHSRVTAIPNGVDTSYFQPAGAGSRPNSVVFVGGLTWFPNLDAIGYFCAEILPLILREIPDFTITVVGKNPSSGVDEAIQGNPHVRLAGLVEDVRPYIEEATAYVVPLRVGGGTRLKILDALASGKALISTSVGAEGLELEPGRDILIADDPRSFADAVVRVLRNASVAQELAHNGRAAVQRRYEWNVIARGLLDVYQRCAQRQPQYAR